MRGPTSSCWAPIHLMGPSSVPQNPDSFCRSLIHSMTLRYASPSLIQPAETWFIPQGSQGILSCEALVCFKGPVLFHQALIHLAAAVSGLRPVAVFKPINNKQLLSPCSSCRPRSVLQDLLVCVHYAKTTDIGTMAIALATWRLVQRHILQHLIASQHITLMSNRSGKWQANNVLLGHLL